MIKILLLLLFPVIAMAEPFPVDYTEPSGQSGTLAMTCVYYCVCKKASTCNCTDWQRQVCVDSDDGNGGDAKNDVTLNIPINEDDLPVTVRYAVTAINDNGNESSKVIGSPNHTFTAP
jgi:hypothetical protein